MQGHKEWYIEENASNLIFSIFSKRLLECSWTGQSHLPIHSIWSINPVLAILWYASPYCWQRLLDSKLGQPPKNTRMVHGLNRQLVNVIAMEFLWNSGTNIMPTQILPLSEFLTMTFMPTQLIDIFINWSRMIRTSLPLNTPTTAHCNHVKFD